MAAAPKKLYDENSVSKLTCYVGHGAEQQDVRGENQEPEIKRSQQPKSITWKTIISSLIQTAGLRPSRR
jgi:hypothetical protein